jgi:hypothetical protein
MIVHSTDLSAGPRAGSRRWSRSLIGGSPPSGPTIIWLGHRQAPRRRPVGRGDDMIWPEPWSPNPWEEELGPLLTGAEVAVLLEAASWSLLNAMRWRRETIILHDSSGSPRFPAFQFGEGQILDELVEAFWIVNDVAMDPWRSAAWCVAADDELSGLTPAEWAWLGKESGRLTYAAWRHVARLR